MTFFSYSSPLSVASLGILFLVGSSFFLSAGELKVGTKVIYSGGADQPPQEKDTGVKLKADVIGIAAPGKEEEVIDQDELDGFLTERNFKAILEKTEKKTDLVSKSYEVLALMGEGRKSEAGGKAKKVLKSEELPDDLRTKVEDALTQISSGTEKTDGGL
ncbi:MAG: hypothetical protein WA705_28885 [Candidatus Ozemobacteraceae bacterium]